MSYKEIEALQNKIKKEYEQELLSKKQKSEQVEALKVFDGKSKLIACPACEKSVSAQAISCPGCGHNIESFMYDIKRKIAQGEIVKWRETPEARKGKQKYREALVKQETWRKAGRCGSCGASTDSGSRGGTRCSKSCGGRTRNCPICSTAFIRKTYLSTGTSTSSEDYCSRCGYYFDSINSVYGK